MTKYSKIKKSSFAILALSLILVAVFAFGGTYAYFNASVTAEGSLVAGTLTLNEGSAEAVSLTEDSKIVPNQKIDLTTTLGAITLEGNTVSALRIALGTVTVTAADGETTLDASKVSLVFTQPTTTTWNAGTETGTYYYGKTVDGTTCATLATALTGCKVTIQLAADADNSYQGATIEYSVEIDAAQAEYHAKIDDNDGTPIAVNETITAENAAQLTWN